MSIVLYVIGAFAVMAGAVMVAFGVPINEFSFGNTLIVSGVTATTGGLIVIGLAAAVAQLHRMTDTLAARPLARAARAGEAVDVAAEMPVAPPPTARAPFPARQRPEAPAREPFEPRIAPPAETGEPFPSPSFAPSLRNPEAPPLAYEEDVSLSPRHPTGGPPPDFGPQERPPPPPGANGRAGEQGHEPTFEPLRRTPPHEIPPTNFDSMWPAEPKPPRGPAPSPPVARPERPPVAPPQAAEPAAASPPRPVAILKSGVVDGMAYTLYVDGSIEAELPQGTLRFASIEDLRSHLEKNS
jgi:hypothetical protein